MKRKDVTLTKEEVVKVVERAIELLDNFEIRYICHALADGIEYVKNVDDVLEHDSPFTYKLLTKYFSGLLEVATEYVPKYVALHGDYDVFVKSNFKFTGQSWFSGLSTSMRKLRIELLTLYIDKLNEQTDV